MRVLSVLTPLFFLLNLLIQTPGLHGFEWFPLLYLEPKGFFFLKSNKKEWQLPYRAQIYKKKKKK